MHFCTMFKPMYIRWIAIIALLFVTSNTALSAVSSWKKVQQVWAEESDVDDFDSLEEADDESKLNFDFDFDYFLANSVYSFLETGVTLIDKQLITVFSNKTFRNNKSPKYILHCQFKIAC
jgi:TRAP-type C4-dicarboxylate transport system permease small subunit